jgi:threonine/homoserine/homoserine lactone efflux protein
MFRAMLTFVPVAVLLSITPGAVVLIVLGLRSLFGRRDADAQTAAGGWGRRVERLTGAVLIGLGIRLAFERR